MPRRLTVFMLFVLFLTGCDGQWGARSFTYKLHNPQNDGQYSTLHSMPSGALLMLSKRSEQPKQIWNLLRITDWDTSQPREDKLDVDVGPNEEYYGQLNGGARYDRNDELLMDPGGNYLVVRLSQDADAWDLNSGEPAKPPRSVLNIIDLHGFKLLRRIAITDPLLAAGDMGFSPKGVFMVSGLQEHSSATATAGYVTHTGQYAVETLTIPGLEPETVCRYTMVSRTYTAQTPSTPEESRRIDQEHAEEIEREQNRKQAANNACAPKLAPLGFSSLDDVYKAFNSWGRLQYNVDYTMRIPADATGPWGCGFEDLSGDLQYSLVDCDQGRVVVFGRYRAFRVFRLADGRKIMDLKVPRSTLFGERRVLFSGVLATSRGATYVVLLRDGAQLEGYRVP
jgi:hypothetical protein